MNLTLDEMLKSARLSAKHQFIIATGDALVELLLSQARIQNKDRNTCFKELLEKHMECGDTCNIYDLISILEYSTSINSVVDQETRLDAIRQLKMKRNKIILRYEQE